MQSKEEQEIELAVIAGKKDNGLLKAAIDKFAARFPEDRETVIYWRAFIEHRLGNYAKEIELLSSVIDEAGEKFSICRMTRADVYLVQKKFDLALRDMNICLSDTSPMTVERFHPSLNYRKALILALTGHEEFELALAKVPTDYSEYVLGARRLPSDLQSLHKSMRTSK